MKPWSEEELLYPIKYKISNIFSFLYQGYTDWFNSLSDEDVLLLTLDSLYR